jgi:hypothetical protein
MLTLADAIEALTNFRPLTSTVITEAVIDSRQVKKPTDIISLERHLNEALLLL